MEQIFLSGDRDVSYNVSCATSMAACETQHPGLLCDVVPSAVTSSSRRALSFEDAFDGDSTGVTSRRLYMKEIKPSPSPPPAYTYLDLNLESEISVTTPSKDSSDRFGSRISWELTCKIPKWVAGHFIWVAGGLKWVDRSLKQETLSITGGGPYSATHAVPMTDWGGLKRGYGRTHCTLHVKPSYSDGWSGAIWTDPFGGPKHDTATRALATWTAPGWTDRSFIIGRVPQQRELENGDVGDTASFHTFERSPFYR